MASLGGPTIDIRTNGGGDITIEPASSSDSNPNINLFTDEYTGTGKAYYKGIEIATVSQIPTVNNATLTIQNNGITVNTFTANASSNVTANIITPQIQRFI